MVQKLVEGKKRKALLQAWDENQSELDMLELRTIKKSKHVHAARDAKAGEIVLVPLSINILFAKAADDITGASVPFGPPLSQSGPFPYIPMCKIQKELIEESDVDSDATNKKDDFVVPYWFVRSSTEEDQVNMAASTINIKVDGEKFVVPVLTNARKVNATECLLIRKVASATTPSAAPAPKKGKGKGKSGKK